MSETGREMNRARLVRDLVAVAVGLVALGAAIWSVILGGLAVALVWLAVSLILSAFVLAMRQERPAPRPDGLAAPDDTNAMHLARERGPDTT